MLCYFCQINKKEYLILSNGYCICLECYKQDLSNKNNICQKCGGPISMFQNKCILKNYCNHAKKHGILPQHL